MTLNKPGKTATVFGGTGFIGRYLVQRLARDGYSVRVPTRQPSKANRLRVSGVVGQVVPLKMSLRDDDALAAAVDGADWVINLVGILAETRHQKFRPYTQTCPAGSQKPQKPPECDPWSKSQPSALMRKALRVMRKPRRRANRRSWMPSPRRQY
ncbi:MAG: NAD-dependent epimerase/dehydratase family protein [Pseudomonadota bacterium]